MRAEHAWRLAQPHVRDGKLTAMLNTTLAVRSSPDSERDRWPLTVRPSAEQPPHTTRRSIIIMRPDHVPLLSSRTPTEEATSGPQWTPLLKCVHPYSVHTIGSGNHTYVRLERPCRLSPPWRHGLSSRLERPRRLPEITASTLEGKRPTCYR